MPIHALTHAGLSRLGDQSRLIELVDEVVEIVAGLEYNISPLAAVSTTGTTLGTIGFPMEGHAALTAVSGSGEDLDLVNKHGLESG